MSSKYVSLNNAGQTHFGAAAQGEVDKSRMTSTPIHYTAFNGGDIVPFGCFEILPNDTFDCNVDAVVRQTTLLTPTMGELELDIYAFFVPHRIVNQSFKAVMGENYSGSWIANNVSLATCKTAFSATGSTVIPVGSVADFYGIPTQQPFPNALLAKMHDLKYRGYVMIYNEFFRDQNYQPPIPMSTLNVYQGFFDTANADDDTVSVDGNRSADRSVQMPAGTVGDGSFGIGAVANALYGSGKSNVDSKIGASVPSAPADVPAQYRRFKAVLPPLKANKLHDYFTSVLPSPQKSPTLFIPVVGTISNPLQVETGSISGASSNPSINPLWWKDKTSGSILSTNSVGFNLDYGPTGRGTVVGDTSSASTASQQIVPANLVVSAGTVVDGLSLSIDDLRMTAAIQQVYESLARGGSRYREYVKNFFGLEVDDPYKDIPEYLGHMRRKLDVYQTAQTSGSGDTPQGNLAAFGYTSTSGSLFKKTFLEHGYLHILGVVRHRNVYPSYLARDNFRLNMLDFYQPQLANISEQPVYAYQINPFGSNLEQVFGYQEAWAECRFDPDCVTGQMRPGIAGGSLALWNYSDDFNSALTIATGEWLKSNTAAVVDRTLAIKSESAPQFKAAFRFTFDKERAMPVYSVPGLDIV